jgi:hypothetical protein
VASRRRPLRAALAALAAVAAALALSGCVSMASGGPVMSYPVTQGASGQPQSLPQIFPPGPGDGWTAQQIVTGFLTASAASAAFGDRQQTARQYLTPGASKTWTATAGAVVYSVGPLAQPQQPVKKDKKGNATRVTVSIVGELQATLTHYGNYALPAASQPDNPQTFTLDLIGGNWRISKVPPQLLLNIALFQDDYQLRNLYYFDPNQRVLVPDPIYVPLQAPSATLLNTPVDDLTAPPSTFDWLAHGATTSAFPIGTKRVGDVTLDGGVATVNLVGRGIAKAPDSVMKRIWSQLYWTLHGTGQSSPSVRSVTVYRNGKQWNPPDAQGSPVQQPVPFYPATGGSKTFYYVDHAGYLVSLAGIGAKPVPLMKLGKHVTQLAVAPNNRNIAIVRSGTLFTGQLDGKLTPQAGAGYGSLSWDPQGNLWTTRQGQIVVLPGGEAAPAEPRVNVTESNGKSPDGPITFTALRIAPDGVRIALVVGGADLNFGAIAWQPGSTPGRTSVQIRLSPFHVPGSFEAITWYGPDNVVGLGEPGPVVTEYPVSGGTTTPVLGESRMESLTASFGNALVAGLTHGGLVYDATLNGAWVSLGADGAIAPAYPG